MGGAQLQDINFPTQPQPLPGQLGTQPDDESTEVEHNSAKDDFRALMESVNIAEKLDKEKLDKIGADAYNGYILDKESRAEWERKVDEWTKLASQIQEEKSFPWPRASNVKYPLLTIASMQFSARAYPSLLPSDGKVVKAQVIGKDPDGKKVAQADRVSTYMSYQVMHELCGWEEDMDKMLLMLPIVGTMFKKTYWDGVTKQNRSDLILPKDLVVNYWTKNLDTSERISQVITMSPRVLKERQLAGVFLDVDLGDPPVPEDAHNAPANDETTPYTIIEQHNYLDLDDDGYSEPYVTTFHLESGTVLRIAPRFDMDKVVYNDKDKIAKIEAVKYFTKYGFIPSPDGGFYDIGFGALLGPLNESVNTLINQLVDSGTLNNLQSGFLGKGLRIRMGEQRFLPGEWKAVNATGDDLKKQIVPLPSKEPSAVLFQLMGSLITSGKELASVAEIFVGKMPGQNTPATTTMATIEQGMKVFTAVYKRIYRSLAEEFEKLYDLNNTYLDPNTYQEVLDITIGPDDFNRKNHQICPAADPTAVSQTEKLLKAQGLMELMPLGILDPVKVGLRMLEAQEQPNIQDLLNPTVAQTGALPQPGPDPKQMESEAKIKAIEAASNVKQQELAFKSQLDQRDLQFKQAMEAQKNQMELRHKDMMNKLEMLARVHGERMRTAQSTQQFARDTTHKEVSHRQDVAHKERMASVKEKQAAKSKPSKGK